MYSLFSVIYKTLHRFFYTRGFEFKHQSKEFNKKKVIFFVYFKITMVQFVNHLTLDTAQQFVVVIVMG